MTTDELVRINKNYFVITANTAAKNAVFVAFPYLNVPPLNFLVSQAISWIVNKIADGMELGAFFIYVDFRVDAQGKEYVQATHDAEKLKTEESRIKADLAFKRFAKLRIGS